MPKGKRKKYDGLRPPSLRGAVVVADFQGTPRISKWPKPRGKNRNPTNKKWTGWLQGVTYLYRYQSAKVQSQFQSATKGTPWMPRDPFISGVRGRAWSITDQTGRTYYPMAARAAVSQSLDAITQVVGQFLMRTADGWVGVDAPTGGSPVEAWYSQSTSALSTATNWVGTMCEMAEDIEVSALAFFGQTVASNTYQALVATLDGSNQITAVTLSPQYTLPPGYPTGTRRILWLPFTNPVPLEDGERYALMVGRPLVSTTTNVGCNAANASIGPFQFPWEGPDANQRTTLAKAVPAIGDTITVTTTAAPALGVQFSRA